MVKAQLRRHFVESPRLNEMAEHLMRLPQIHVQRWVERLDTIIRHRVRAIKGQLVPAQRFFWVVLAARHVVGGDAGLKVVTSGFPRAQVQRFGVVDSPVEFGLGPLRANLHDGIVEIHPRSLFDLVSRSATRRLRRRVALLETIRLKDSYPNESFIKLANHLPIVW